MAGDWIKVERATLKKPEILEAAELLGIGRRETLGLFLDYFAWLDENMPDSCNGFVTHASRKSVDEALHVPGFAAVLEQIGWAQFDDSKRTLTVIHHERHNGNTAKSRALTQKRVQRFRNDSNVTQAFPEKRREEKSLKTLTTSSGRSKSAPTNAAFRQQAKDALERLNRLSGSHFESVPANVDPIIARLREGYSERDLRVVIATKCREWKEDEKMAKHLTPKTLFNRTNFASYAGQVPPLDLT